MENKIEEKYEEYLDKAKDLAQDAKELAHNVKEQALNSKAQTSSYSFGAKEKVQEKVQGIMQDAKATKEISQAAEALEAFKEFEGSIIYKMEIETIGNSLNSLLLVIRDNRLDDGSVAEEIKKVMEVVAPAEATAIAPASSDEPSGAPANEPTIAPASSDEPTIATPSEITEEQQMIEKAKSLAYNACSKALALIGNAGA